MVAAVIQQLVCVYRSVEQLFKRIQTGLREPLSTIRFMLFKQNLMFEVRR